MLGNSSLSIYQKSDTPPIPTVTGPPLICHSPSGNSHEHHLSHLSRLHRQNDRKKLGMEDLATKLNIYVPLQC